MTNRAAAAVVKIDIQTRSIKNGEKNQVAHKFFSKLATTSMSLGVEWLIRKSKFKFARAFMILACTHLEALSSLFSEIKTAVISSAVFFAFFTRKIFLSRILEMNKLCLSLNVSQDLTSLVGFHDAIRLSTGWQILMFNESRESSSV